MKKATLIFMFLFLACNSDQNEKIYDNYEKAKLDNLFEKGWIPRELIYKSMSNIIVKSNIDINTCFFSYKLSQKDFENIKSKIELDNWNFIKPKRICISESLNEKIINLEKFSFAAEEGKEKIQIGIDNKKHEVFGWY